MRRIFPLSDLFRDRLRRLTATLTHGIMLATRIACFTLLGVFVLAAPAQAQKIKTVPVQKTQSNDAPSAEKPKDRLAVEATEILYNRDKNTVSAEGDVHLYYQGRTLEADHVIYDRTKNRVYAEGNAKITEKDGSVAYATRFDLTDDFKDGFIDSLRLDTADKTHFVAPRAERTDGTTTVFNKGTYTACDSCKDDPERPPLWQVRAKRIIHNNDEHMVYYEDATLELLGIPLAYVPYFSAPDASVTRKSGLLNPHFVMKSQLGYGMSMPYFVNLAPNYDLTLTPTYLMKQGLLGQVEWRHRLINGSYNIRLNGISQEQPGQFANAPYGSGNRRLRGSFESAGEFYINDKWKFGWDIAVPSDRQFFENYKIRSESLSSNYFRESTSSVFLNGQGDRGYFDIRGFYFRALSNYDYQKQQPVVHPVWDYNKTIDIDPAKTAGVGGQFEIDYNLTSLSRAAAAYQGISSTYVRTLDSTYGLYDVCSAYNRTNCLLRGVGGNYTRATLNLNWKRKYIDPLGEVWTPFAFARVNGTWLSLDSSHTFNNLNASGQPLQNSYQSTFLGTDKQDFRGEVVPGIGLDYRFPLVAQSSFATHVLEPIAQIIVRPDEPTRSAFINEDAQSLVFDDTTLFEWNKYSGYDRFEGGTRANYGGQYTMNLQNGGYANVMAGQSFQVAGRNSYASLDAANIGASSGLNTRLSDYVTRVVIAPTANYQFIAKGRFDQNNFNMRRLDLIASATFGPLSTSIQYARYDAQPLLGYAQRRQGILGSASYALTKNYSVNGNVIFDMSRHLYPTQIVGHPGPFSPVSYGGGFAYKDECTTFSLNYSRGYADNGNGTRTTTQTILMQLQLRTLGDARVQSSFGTSVIQDGITSSTQ